MARKKKNVTNGVCIIPRPLKDGSTSYYVKYKEDGQWVKRTCKGGDGEVLHTIPDDMPYAKDINAEVNRQLQAIKAQLMLELSTGEVRKAKVRSCMLVADYIPMYMEQKKGYKGISIIQCMVVNLMEYAPMVKFSQINAEWCAGFQGWLCSKVGRRTGRPLRPKTISSYMVQFMEMLSSAKGKYIDYETNPVVALGKKRVRPDGHNRTYLTADEVKRLEETPCTNEDVKRMFLFGCFCGLRMCDIMSITWGQLMQSKQSQRQLDLTMIKTGVHLALPMNAKCESILNDGKEHKPDELIFKNLSKPTIKVHLERWTKDAGIHKHVTFHTSRHTFACLLLGHDANPLAIKNLLGHKDFASTMVYVEMMDKQKFDAVNLLNDL